MTYRQTSNNSHVLMNSAHQEHFASPLAPGLRKSRSNGYFFASPSPGRIQMYHKPSSQDPRIRTASSSSGAASHHPSIIQKTPRILCDDLVITASPAPSGSMMSIPVTSSDCDTDSDEGSAMEHVPELPNQTVAPAHSSHSAGPTEQVQFPDQPTITFLSPTDRLDHYASMPRDMMPTISNSTETTVAADAPLDVMYGKELTSYPHQTIIEEEMKASLLSLLSIQSFTYMLSKPETRNVFRDWLVIQGGEEKLDRWTQESRINQLHVEAQQSARQLLQHYRENDEKRDGRTSSDLDRLNSDAIKEAVNLAHSSQVLSESRQYLMQSLYNDTFKQFITSKLLEITKMKLRSGVDENTCEGLGDSFCVSNPRLRDNPVVMVSPSFSPVLHRHSDASKIGHERNSIIGKNCRFLQGPGTSPQSIQRLRLALKQGLPCVELLLNYKADGTPFYCLLSIIPLFDEKGFLSYYIGGQINVTDELRNNEIMALISQTNSDPAEITSADFSRSPSTIADRRKSRKVATIDSALLNSLSSSMGSQASESTLGIKPKPSRNRSLNWFSSLMKQEKENVDVRFTKPDDRREFQGSTLRDSLSAFQSTYSRLILFNKSTRTIIFVTPAALNFLGLPSDTIEETYSSALLHRDFLDLVENCKTTRKTAVSKKTLKKIISNNASASFQCELCWSYTMDDQSTRILLKHTKKVHVAETSVVHLTPLIDETGNCASYVAVLS
ncbi:hypothetical protein PSTG_02836 [Puccinia striiformis f. sp. tritici PST-78]|uniref:PAC domain-containing protein n=1 Tax=Puccinia striiformis f. sp. tritici PST-78 TaxID=1165861 RepID=A0A0L0VY68_9BASI|nr:hypothetical protein PSTG_02836 [Puccinia striiformis f. sp. tritici PST-78]